MTERGNVFVDAQKKAADHAAAVKNMKERAKKSRLDHDLHVALLMKRFGLTKPEANIMAYLDGLQGLYDRMDNRDPTDPVPGATQ